MAGRCWKALLFDSLFLLSLRPWSHRLIGIEPKSTREASATEWGCFIIYRKTEAWVSSRMKDLLVLLERLSLRSFKNSKENTPPYGTVGVILDR